MAGTVGVWVATYPCRSNFLSRAMSWMLPGPLPCRRCCPVHAMSGWLLNGHHLLAFLAEIKSIKWCSVLGLYQYNFQFMVHKTRLTLCEYVWWLCALLSFFHISVNVHTQLKEFVDAALFHAWPEAMHFICKFEQVCVGIMCQGSVISATATAHTTSFLNRCCRLAKHSNRLLFFLNCRSANIKHFDHSPW